MSFQDSLFDDELSELTSDPALQNFNFVCWCEVRDELRMHSGNFFAASEKLRYLFVTSAWRDGNPVQDASTLYRCVFHVLNLRNLGGVADLIAQRELKPEMIIHYDCFLFHRPVYNENLISILSKLYASGKKVCCDFDDLVFDEVAIMSSPRRRNGDINPENLFLAAIENQKSLNLFSDVVVSTKPLLDSVLRIGPYRGRVIHNGYSPNWYDRSALSVARKRRGLLDRRVKIFSYFSGSASHDADFKQMIEPLRDAMQKYPDIMLQIVGPLRLPEEGLDTNRIIRRPLVPYIELPDLMANTWLALAPLDLASHFNQSKSALKFFESAVFGIPVIATLSPDMMRFRDHVIALNEDFDILEIVERFSDPSFYEAESNRIRDFAIENCSSMSQTQNLHSFFCEL